MKILSTLLLSGISLLLNAQISGCVYHLTSGKVKIDIVKIPGMTISVPTQAESFQVSKNTQVKLAGFFIMPNEVNVEQYCLFLNSVQKITHDTIIKSWLEYNTDSSFVIFKKKFFPKKGTAEKAITRVSYIGALAYAKWLSQLYFTCSDTLYSNVAQWWPPDFTSYLGLYKNNYFGDTLTKNKNLHYEFSRDYADETNLTSILPQTFDLLPRKPDLFYSNTGFRLIKYFYYGSGYDF